MMYNSLKEEKIKEFMEALHPAFLIDKLLEIHAALSLQVGATEMKQSEHKLCAIDELLRPWFEPTDEEEDQINLVILKAKNARLQKENAALQQRVSLLEEEVALHDKHQPAKDGGHA